MNKLIIKNQLNDGEENINFHFHENTFEEHTHDYYEIMLITQGTGDHFFNGKSYKVKEGDCWFILPSSKHSLSNEDSKLSKHLNVAISTMHMRRLCDAIDVTFLSTLLKNETSAIHITLSKNDYDRIIALAHKFQAIPFDNPIKRNGVLNILTFMLIQSFYLQQTTKNDKMPLFLQKLVNEMSTIEYLESKPSDIIKTIPYSYSNFEKIFKKHLGISFVQYLNNRKIEYAKSLLTTTDLSIITIANKITMHSLSHFYNIFKEKTGLTPTQYRRKYKGVSRISQIK